MAGRACTSGPTTTLSMHGDTPECDDGLLSRGAAHLGGALQQLIYQTATITWADAQPIACDVKSSSSSANNIVIEEVRVLWNPR